MDYFAAVVAISAIVMTGLVTAVLGRAWIMRRQPPRSVAPGQLENIEARLTQLQQSMDDFAIEMERLAEGQRFTAKVLTERAADAEMDPAPKV